MVFLFGVWFGFTPWTITDGIRIGGVSVVVCTLYTIYSRGPATWVLAALVAFIYGA
jgi:hypothetical protein